jgi:DNA-binding NtrC family response regulator
MQYLERTDFSALVCDVRLEGLDGFDILTIARRKNPSLGAVLMTGAPTPEDATQAENLRASYLSKPIGMDQLLRCVREATVRSVAGSEVYAG